MVLPFPTMGKRCRLLCKCKSGMETPFKGAIEHGNIQKPRQLMDSCDRLMIKASRKPLTFSRSHSFRPLCCWLGCDYWCWRCRSFSILNAFCCWAGGGQHMQIDSAKCWMMDPENNNPIELTSCDEVLHSACFCTRDGRQGGECRGFWT